MKLTGDWLHHPGTTAILAALTQAGHQALFVGGAVRNAVMGLPVADIDIATDAVPDRVIALCKDAGFKVVPTGIDHGTLTVISAGRVHEVTTFRRDVATDGRHADVAFGTDLAADAARRDFTMNALYARSDGTVIDPLGGLDDAVTRRVRFVGDPASRITEDYLRILRFFRFHAVYGNAAEGIDAEGLAACSAHISGLDSLSRERIGQEIRKLLAAPDPAPTMASMAQTGILARILPGADPRALAPLIHLEDGAEPRWLRRLAALGGEDAEQHLRLSRVEARLLADLRAAIGSFETPAVLAWRLGAAAARDAILLRGAVLEQLLPGNWAQDLTRGAAAVFPVTAADLMPALSGAALGHRLKQLENRWTASDLRLSAQELLG